MGASGRNSSSFANYAKNNGFRSAERLDYEDVGPGQDYLILPKQHDGDYSSNPAKDVLGFVGAGLGIAAPFLGGATAVAGAQLGALGALSGLTANALGATTDNGPAPGLYEQGSHGKSRASYEKDQENAMVTDYESKAVDSITPQDLHSAPDHTPEPAPQSIVHNAPTSQPQPQQSYEVPQEQEPRDTSYYDRQPTYHNYVQPQPAARLGGLRFNGGPKQKIGKTIRPKKKKSNKKK